MNRILLIFLAVCALGRVRAQDPVCNEGIRGPVHSMRSVQYEAKQDRSGAPVAGRRIGTIQTQCDGLGCMIRKIVRGVDSSHGYSRFEYHYDEQGRLEERKVYYRSGKLNVYNRMEYDSAGWPSRMLTYQGADNRLVVLCCYTRCEGMTFEREYVSYVPGSEDDGDPPAYVFAYNAGGDLMEEQCFNERAAYRYRYQYDGRGNWVRQVRYALPLPGSGTGDGAGEGAFGGGCGGLDEEVPGGGCGGPDRITKRKIRYRR